MHGIEDFPDFVKALPEVDLPFPGCRGWLLQCPDHQVVFAEFAQDQAALRAHLRTWFERSVVLGVILELTRQGRTVVITTDHGNLEVRRPTLVHADRDISSGVRFKFGNAPRCDADAALLVRDPQAFGLPQETGAVAVSRLPHLFSHFVFHHSRAFLGSCALSHFCTREVRAS